MLPNVEGAEVRLRFSCASDQRDAARTGADNLRSELLARGARSVKLEELVRPKTRARAPEVAAATTLAEKLEALWGSRGDDLSVERRTRLKTMASGLEAEANSAA